MATEMTHSAALPMRGRPSGRVSLILLLAIVVVWAFVQGAHDHGTGGTIDPTLATATPDQRVVVDASTGTLDLSAIEVQPGSVVEFLLDGSAGAPHQFLLTGAGEAPIYTTFAPNGDTILRMRVPESGGFSFFCALPGHEGLHGTVVVDLDAQAAPASGVPAAGVN